MKTHPPTVPECLRFLLIGLAFLGILTSTGRADEIDDVLDCLAIQQAGEEDRAGLLHRADSLGILAVRAGGRPSASLQRQIEQIHDQALELELELLFQRNRCRELARRALGSLETAIDQIEVEILGGTGDSEKTAELVRRRALRDRLQAVLAAPAVHNFPMLPLSSDDTRETLADKLQYYKDVEGYLLDLDNRIGKRLDQIRDDSEALREAQRLVSDIDFTDMGDRTSGDRTASLLIKLPGVPDPPGQSDRPRSDIPLDVVEGDLEFALRLSAMTPEDSRRITELLEGFRQDIQRELDTISEQTGEIRGRVDTGSSGAR